MGQIHFIKKHKHRFDLRATGLHVHHIFKKKVPCVDETLQLKSKWLGDGEGSVKILFHLC